MRSVLFQILLVISAVSWAGGEVPWPKESIEDIQLRQMGGLWVSQHIDSPQRMFYFNLERGGISDVCPFVLRAFEVDSTNNKLLSAGGGVYCSDSLNVINIIMYDFDGQARNYLNLVGLKKTDGSNYMGYQMLGVTLSTYSTKPVVVAQDTFYMISQ